MVFIFLFSGPIVTLGIDGECDVCQCSGCLRGREGEGAIGRKAGADHIGL